MAKCIFCSDPADRFIEVAHDYVAVAKLPATEAYIPINLPCCFECCELLSEVHYSSLEGAARYLTSIYKEIYAHLLRDMLWDEEEIGELGYNLKTYITQSYKAQIEALNRVNCCEQVAIFGPTIDDDLMDEIKYQISLRLPKSPDPAALK
jgi:hypothetical protein